MAKRLALILEDEYLIANDVAESLEREGFDVICVATEAAAEKWLDEITPDVAIVDIRLLDGETGQGATRLKALGVPFIVHSGYEPAFQPSIFRDAPFVVKPAPVEELVRLAVGLAKQQPRSARAPFNI
ncbi:hypothetical protein [Mesorhizobium sp.]|uniref:hypothetical protein n=1 Tax=Mesorhizobium sp. TaxID=1871066 RepID=UPI000FE6C45E|nr:hypothetical protein [Mesorhizobium sp.]RWD71664.1 MAG: response regulator transcription factor [Mesorhizobium sp.]